MVLLREKVEARLRGEGWDVRPGLLYGGEWLISKGGSQQGHVHSQYIVHFAEGMTYQRLLGSLRVAASVRKKVLLAAETPTGDVDLIEVQDD